MQTLSQIQLYKGATSEVEFDLTNFVIPEGGKVVFTIKAMGRNTPVFTTEFETSVKHTVVFSDEFTANLVLGQAYEYDLMLHIGGERYPQCSPSKVILDRVVGNCDN